MVGEENASKFGNILYQLIVLNTSTVNPVI